MDCDGSEMFLQVERIAGPRAAHHKVWGACSVGFMGQGRFLFHLAEAGGLPQEPLWPRAEPLEQRLWTCGLAGSLLKAKCGSTSACSETARASVHQETTSTGLSGIHGSSQSKSLFHLVCGIKTDLLELSRHLIFLIVYVSCRWRKWGRAQDWDTGHVITCRWG